MLEPAMTPPIPTSRPRAELVDQHMEESLTDGYGEPSTNPRTTSGGVDFFSSLGTEHRKKHPPKTEEVSPSAFLILHDTDTPEAKN